MQRRKYNNVQHAKELQNAAGPCLHWIATLNCNHYLYVLRIYSTNILFNVPMKNRSMTINDRKFTYDLSITKMMKKDFPELVVPNFYLDIYFHLDDITLDNVCRNIYRTREQHIYYETPDEKDLLPGSMQQ